MSVVVTKNNNGNVVLHAQYKITQNLILTFSEAPTFIPSSLSLPPQYAAGNNLFIGATTSQTANGSITQFTYSFNLTGGPPATNNISLALLNTPFNYLPGITFASSNTLQALSLTLIRSTKIDGLLGYMSFTGTPDIITGAQVITLTLTTGTVIPTNLDMSINYNNIITSSNGTITGFSGSGTTYTFTFTPLSINISSSITIPSGGLLSSEDGGINQNIITLINPAINLTPTPTPTPTSIDTFNYSHIICYSNNGNQYQSIHSAIYNENFSIRNNLLYILSQYLVNTELKTYILPSLNQSYLFYDPINNTVPGVQSLIDFMITTPLLESDVPKFISNIKKMYPMLSKFVKSYYDPRFNTESCDEKTNKWMNSFTHLHCDLKLILNN